ncbi:uncharacterized protein AC631_02774 [Debaryomyces fabryi]|uniref:phosphoadenylyl-sulfate reductase (thioredoxin) n=1 Tax=Debaryomyces fabryi TaxID=58627 RepID=A0A0V1PYX5_9ASCO|nr:uncharacterized protein AC631_02774 [Debaryomyces fabryi]KSA01480.1 hypothetical protein AC631_02774 [Debaryomyces fabryi]CUM57445.1 unnamed protein product [Debaryomyces fabryi]
MTVTGPVNLSAEHLQHLNEKLQKLSPEDIIKWAYVTFPNLYQTTAFGLTGLVTIDMISKLKPEEGHLIDLIFIDTLHHFPQTYDLINNVSKKYNSKIHTFKPLNVETEAEFSQRYGDQLWETNDSYYDFLVKVEPSQRAYKELQVVAVLTGRRKSQGGARGTLPVIEIEESSGTIKINPLCNWDFNQVKSYIDEHNVPYNELLDLGYKSIGDWHSTVPVAEGEDERSGRWKGKAKTECGIHETSKFAQYLQSTENSTANN